VHEHNEEIAYVPGFIALGRLIPLDGGRWLRSPGMAFGSAPNDELAPALARAVRASTDTLGPALTIEAAIATMMSGTRATLPLAVKPARSAAEAKALSWELNEVLQEAGLAKRVAKKRAPAELRDVALAPGTQLFEFSVDAAVGEWMQALIEMGGTGAPGATRARRPQRWGK